MYMNTLKVFFIIDVSDIGTKIH